MISTSRLKRLGVEVLIIVYSLDDTETRRHRYRNRSDTISRMLQDGEKHRVWRPGRRRDQAVQKSTDQRQKTLLNRINTYRKGGKGEGKGGGKVTPISNIQRRLIAWRKIEEEARMLSVRDAAEGVAAAEATNRGVLEDTESWIGCPEVRVECRSGARGSNLMLPILEEEEGEGERKEVGGVKGKGKGAKVREGDEEDTDGAVEYARDGTPTTSSRPRLLAAASHHSTGASTQVSSSTQPHPTQYRESAV